MNVTIVGHHYQKLKVEGSEALSSKQYMVVDNYNDTSTNNDVITTTHALAYVQRRHSSLVVSFVVITERYYHYTDYNIYYVSLE